MFNKRRTTHGLRYHPLYQIWKGIKARCYQKNRKCYKNYGGRGIRVCDIWKSDFQKFYDWAIENGYQNNLTIDRIDNNGNYEPSNCRWITNQKQQNNRRNNHLLTFNHRTQTVTEWANELKISYHVIFARLKYGWTIEKTLTTPPLWNRIKCQ